jgi:hypothetical protein
MLLFLKENKLQRLHARLFTISEINGIQDEKSIDS